MTRLTVTINGSPHGPFEVRDEMTMNDFLRETVGLTGTKFGCGAAQCLSCAVIVDSPDGTSHTSPTCIVPAVAFDGQAIRTVEGHADGWRADAAAEGLRRAFRLPVRLLHRRAFSTRDRCCSSGSNARRSRGARSRRRSPRPSTGISAGARVTSNTTRRFGTRCSPTRAGTCAERPNEERAEGRGEEASARGLGAGRPGASGTGRCPGGGPRLAGEPDGRGDEGRAVRRALRRARQGADQSALHQLPPGRRPAAPGRSRPAAPAARRPRARRLRRRGDALRGLPQGGELRPGGRARPRRLAPRAGRDGMGGKVARERSARRSRTRSATATGRSTISSSTSGATASSAGHGRRGPGARRLPGTQAEAGALAAAWVETGAECPRD